MTVRSSQEARFDICWDTCSINFVTINMIEFGNIGAERFKGIGIGVMQRGKYTLGFHEI